MTDDPEALTQFIHRCRGRGVRAQELRECLQLVTTSALTPPASGERIWARQRYALLLALGEYRLGEIPELEREPLIERLADWYARDPSSGVHGAAGWLLRHWGRSGIVKQVDQTLIPYSPDREWFTLAIETNSATTQSADTSLETEQSGEAANQLQETNDESNPTTLYMTFVVFQPGVYQLGCPSNGTPPHRVTITRPFAALDREITWEWYNASGGWQHAAWEKKAQWKLTSDMPACGINWYESVAYCRWLTEQAGMAELDQCYRAPDELEKDKDGNPETWPIDLDKPGFRLLTEAEWEVACRATMRSAYSFGGDTSWLSQYAWYDEVPSRPVAGLRPNPRGLYDMHGNLYEWCHDWYSRYVPDKLIDSTGPTNGSFRVSRGGSWSDDAAHCRSSARGYDPPPSLRSFDLGFRLALVPSSKDAERQEERAEAFDSSQAEPDGS